LVIGNLILPALLNRHFEYCDLGFSCRIREIKSLLSESASVDFDVPLARFTDILNFESIKVM